ncbi:lysine decarboxylase, partial [bacterium]|nr:lysine decarboxylase [bacterium]
MKKNKIPLRAYENLEFLHSPEGRVIRMLSEFYEPQKRFKKLSVRDTIVFFGSARTPAPETAKKNFLAIQKKIASHKKPSKKLLQQFDDLKMKLDMSKYYADAVQLAYLLTR